jgi:26S proteasome regulatory subunit N10
MITVLQEATVVCIDNSEFTRNGDYAPTRFQAQADAVNLLAGAKTQHHPENTVGVMTMGGKTPRVLVTPTPDLGKVLNAMQEMKIEGQVNLATAVQIAQLALKHRENKNQRQRVVVFVGSPIAEEKDALVKIAKKLKKNNVAVDIVSFGSEEENAEKLEAFHGAVNSNGNSHLVTVPPGTILSDMLFSTPIFMEEGANGGGEEGGAPAAPRTNIVDGFDYGELGVDPNLDPELALALRVSIEEERARQAAATAAAGGSAAAGEGDGGATAADAAGGAAAATPEAAAAPGGGEEGDDGVQDMDEDALLQQALALSMQVEQPTPAASQGPTATPAAPAKSEAPTPAGPTPGTTAAAPATAAVLEHDPMLEIDDPELAMALKMSMEESKKEEEKE